MTDTERTIINTEFLFIANLIYSGELLKAQELIESLYNFLERKQTELSFSEYVFNKIQKILNDLDSLSDDIRREVGDTE